MSSERRAPKPRFPIFLFIFFFDGVQCMKHCTEFQISLIGYLVGQER
jgi:hypothetical protein